MFVLLLADSKQPAPIVELVLRFLVPEGTFMSQKANGKSEKEAPRISYRPQFTYKNLR